jgi:hypothetical protein
MGLLDLFSSKSNTNTSSTAVAVDSYNRVFNSVRNNSNSGNLQISVGGSDPFGLPGEKLQRQALYVVGGLGAVALVAYWLRKRN